MLKRSYGAQTWAGKDLREMGCNRRAKSSDNYSFNTSLAEDGEYCVCIKNVGLETKCSMNYTLLQIVIVHIMIEVVCLTSNFTNLFISYLNWIASHVGEKDASRSCL